MSMTSNTAAPLASIAPAGEPLTAANDLNCCPCTDDAIINSTPIKDVPAAVTMAPSAQMFTINGQQIMAPVVLPVCAPCRKNQLGIASKTGLVVA